MADPIRIHTESEARVVAEVVKQAIEPRLMELKRGSKDACLALLAPAQVELSGIKDYLDEYLERPERRTGTAKLDELPSFIAHVNRFKDKDSALFATVPASSPPVLIGVLNYHCQGAESDPRWGDHQARYEFPISEEWQAWMRAHNGGILSQEAFASFIEDRIADVASPDKAGKGAVAFVDQVGCTLASPAQLLGLSKGLAFHVGHACSDKVNLSSGEVQLQFTEEHKDSQGAPLKIPGAFLIAIPVFRNGANYQVAVRLRYRIKDGRVFWWCNLYRPDRCLDDAFREACSKAQTETGLPLFYGAQEEVE